MIGWFPTPYQDELFYSICARYQERAAYPSSRTTNEALFGNRNITQAIDLPNHLELFISNLPRGHRWTVERIIDEHTLFPYFRPFLSPQRVSRVHDSMRGSGSLIAKIASGSAATSIRLANQLRYCPKCSDEDMKLQREPYWHRLHQMPGVEVCPVHHVFLEHSTARARNRSNIHDYVSAGRAVCTAVSRQIDREDPAHQALLNVARDLDDSLAPAVAESAEHIKSAETPRRITLYAIGQDIDSYDYLRKHDSKLPKTARVLTQVLETHVKFTKRKLYTAALDIRKRGLIITRVELLKAAKVSRTLMRDSTIEEFIEEAIHSVIRPGSVA